MMFVDRLGIKNRNMCFTALGSTVEIDPVEKVKDFEKKDCYDQSQHMSTSDFVKSVMEKDIAMNGISQSSHVAFIHKQEEVLIVKNKYTKKWQLPGGAKDTVEETDEQCACREVLEECGYVCDDYIQNAKKISSEQKVRYVGVETPIVRQRAFFVVALDTKIEVNPSQEISEYQWASLRCLRYLYSTRQMAANQFITISNLLKSV